MLVFASAPIQFNQRPRRAYYNTQPAFYGFNDFGYDDYVSLRHIELARRQRQTELEQHRLILHLQEVERRRQLQVQAELERQAARRNCIAQLNGLHDLFNLAIVDESQTPSPHQLYRRGSRCGPQSRRRQQPRYTGEDVIASILGLTLPPSETKAGARPEKKVRFAPSQDPEKVKPIPEVEQFERFLASLSGQVNDTPTNTQPATEEIRCGQANCCKNAQPAKADTEKVKPIPEVEKFERFLSSLASELNDTPTNAQPRAAKKETRCGQAKCCKSAQPAKADTDLVQLHHFFESFLNGLPSAPKEKAGHCCRDPKSGANLRPACHAERDAQATKTPRQQEKQPQAAPAPAPTQPSELEQFMAALLSTPGLFPSQEPDVKTETQAKEERVPRKPRQNRFYEWYAREAVGREQELRRRNAMRRASVPVAAAAPVRVEVQEKATQTPSKEVKEKETTPPVEDPQLTHRTSLATLSSIQTSLSSLTPPRSTSPTPKQETKAYEEALMKVLERLDGVESNGDVAVRDVRRSLVMAVEGELEKIDSERESTTSTPLPDSIEKQDAKPPALVHPKPEQEREVAGTTSVVAGDRESVKTEVSEVTPSFETAAQASPVDVVISKPAPAHLTETENGVPLTSEGVSESEADAQGIADVGRNVAEPEASVSPPDPRATGVELDLTASPRASPAPKNVENDEVQANLTEGLPLDHPTPAEPTEDEDDSDVRSLSSEESFAPSEYETQQPLSMPEEPTAGDSLKLKSSRSHPDLSPEDDETASVSSESEAESDGLDEDTVLLSSGHEEEGNGEKFEVV